MKSILSVLCWLLLASSLHSQITVKERYDAHEPIVLNCECPGPEGSKKHVIWEISGAARLREVGGDACVWAPPGKYRVSSTVLLTLEKDLGGELVEVLVPGGFRRFSAEFVVGPAPAPDPPTPDPDQPDPPGDCSLPSERATLICQTVASTVPPAAQGKRAALSDVFSEVATGLETGRFLTINVSNAFLQAEVGKVLDTQALKDDWAKFQGRLADLLRDLPAGRADLITFYKDVAAGLKGS